MCSLRIRITTLRHIGNVSGSIENQQLTGYKTVHFVPNLGITTIDLRFIANNKLVACVNMCTSNFGNKILGTLTAEELEKFIPITVNGVFFTVGKGLVVISSVRRMIV